MANSTDESSKGPELGRRAFLGAATLGTGAALAGVPVPALAATASPQVDFPADPRTFGGGPPSTNNRAEIDLYDC